MGEFDKGCEDPRSERASHQFQQAFDVQLGWLSRHLAQSPKSFDVCVSIYVYIYIHMHGRPPFYFLHNRDLLAYVQCPLGLQMPCRTHCNLQCFCEMLYFVPDVF